jgi:hypothetical protein
MDEWSDYFGNSVAFHASVLSTRHTNVEMSSFSEFFAGSMHKKNQAAQD